MLDCNNKGHLPLSAMLSAVMVKDADGNVGIRTVTVDAECDTLTNMVDCDANMPFEDMLRAAFTMDDCGKPAIRLFNSIPVVP